MRVTRRQAIAAAGGLAAGLAAAPPARAETQLKIVLNAWPSEQIKPLFDQFAAANPQIKPDPESVPTADLLPTLDTQLGARTTEPDLYSCPGQFTASYAVHGHAMALDDIIDEKRFVKVALDAGRFRRKLYSVPFASACQLMFYNRALFR
jgi:ABC-type glycerol-3-phosphate transport system substrate-binding protein